MITQAVRALCGLSAVRSPPFAACRPVLLRQALPACLCRSVWATGRPVLLMLRRSLKPPGGEDDEEAALVSPRKKKKKKKTAADDDDGEAKE